jgi:peptidoglycan/xylan/chitin deacetylase (PgdA/CDA1 family)
MLADGHHVGNHGYSHPDYAKLRLDEIIADFDECDDVLSKITRRRRHLIRPPNGFWSIALVRALRARLGHGPILWSKCVHREHKRSEQELSKRLGKMRLSDGDIVLLHDINEVTAKALPRLMDNFKHRGLHCHSLQRFLVLPD